MPIEFDDAEVGIADHLTTQAEQKIDEGRRQFFAGLLQRDPSNDKAQYRKSPHWLLRWQTNEQMDQPRESRGRVYSRRQVLRWGGIAAGAGVAITAPFREQIMDLFSSPEYPVAQLPEGATAGSVLMIAYRYVEEYKNVNIQVNRSEAAETGVSDSFLRQLGRKYENMKKMYNLINTRVGTIQQIESTRPAIQVLHQSKGIEAVIAMNIEWLNDSDPYKDIKQAYELVMRYYNEIRDLISKKGAELSSPNSPEGLTQIHKDTPQAQNVRVTDKSEREKDIDFEMSQGIPGQRYVVARVLMNITRGATVDKRYKFYNVSLESNDKMASIKAQEDHPFDIQEITIFPPTKSHNAIKVFALFGSEIKIPQFNKEYSVDKLEKPPRNKTAEQLLKQAKQFTLLAKRLDVKLSKEEVQETGIDLRDLNQWSTNIIAVESIYNAMIGFQKRILKFEETAPEIASDRKSNPSFEDFIFSNPKFLALHKSVQKNYLGFRAAYVHLVRSYTQLHEKVVALGAYLASNTAPFGIKKRHENNPQVTEIRRKQFEGKPHLIINYNKKHPDRKGYLRLAFIISYDKPGKSRAKKIIQKVVEVRPNAQEVYIRDNFSDPSLAKDFPNAKVERISILPMMRTKQAAELLDFVGGGHINRSFTYNIPGSTNTIEFPEQSSYHPQGALEKRK